MIARMIQLVVEWAGEVGLIGKERGGGRKQKTQQKMQRGRGTSQLDNLGIIYMQIPHKMLELASDLISINTKPSSHLRRRGFLILRLLRLLLGTVDKTATVNVVGQWRCYDLPLGLARAILALVTHRRTPHRRGDLHHWICLHPRLLLRASSGSSREAQTEMKWILPLSDLRS